jgi:hypothetical protein
MIQELNKLYQTVIDICSIYKWLYKDTTLDRLLSYIDPNPMDVQFMGRGGFGQETHDYVIALWNGGSVVGIKNYIGDGKPDYTFIHNIVSDKGSLEKIRGTYSTVLPNKEEKFNHEMGTAVMNSQDAAQYILMGILTEAIVARRALIQNPAKSN